MTKNTIQSVIAEFQQNLAARDQAILEISRSLQSVAARLESLTMGTERASQQKPKKARKPRVSYGPEKRERALAMLASGHKVAEIAIQLGIPGQTIRTWKSRHTAAIDKLAL